MMVSRLGFGGIPIQRVTEDEAVMSTKEDRELIDQLRAIGYVK